MFKVFFLSYFFQRKFVKLFSVLDAMVLFMEKKYYLPLFCDRQVFVDIHECDGRELLPTHFDWWARETCFA